MTRCITGIFVKKQFERFLKAAKHRRDSGGGGGSVAKGRSTSEYLAQ